jgi:hypothetical protein
MTVMTLEVLPAEEGDCLLLTCHADDGDRHLLVDAGTAATKPALLERLQRLAPRRIEILVVTHIDADHIGGVIPLLQDGAFDLDIGDAWFNGYRHLPRVAATRAFKEGELLTELLTGGGTGDGARHVPWNTLFSGGAVMRGPDDKKTGRVLAPLPEITLPWGLKITLLSPTPLRLNALFEGWRKYLEELHKNQPSLETQQPPRTTTRGESLEGIARRESNKDAARPNGSSIAFLAEFRGRSILFGADAFATVLYPALVQLAARRAGLADDVDEKCVPPLHVDVFKLPHHGSQGNVLFKLFDVIRADHYVISTNGKKKSSHPDEEAIARVIVRGRPSHGGRHTLWFNYASHTTTRWMDESLKRDYNYDTAGAVTGGSAGAILKI